VLGGGGLVGHAWHLGVLAGLADATGWDACSSELIVGTSAGAVVGAELRAGPHPVDLLRPGVGAAPATLPRPFLHPRSRRPAALGTAARALATRAPAGLVLAGLLPRGRRDPALISEALARFFPPGAVWPPGLWVCTVRLRDGRRVVFGRGGGEEVGLPSADLPTVVAASCAMGGFFRPVVIAGEEHVDGGSRSVTNADLAAGVGADLVVVSSPMSVDQVVARQPRSGPGSGPGAARPAARLHRAHRLVHARRLARELVAVRRSGSLVLALEPGADDLAVMGSVGASMDFERRVAVADQARRTAAHRIRSSGLTEVRRVLEAGHRA
jgi:NTE family protein